jgi:hypothetical protein
MRYSGHLFGLALQCAPPIDRSDLGLDSLNTRLSSTKAIPLEYASHGLVFPLWRATRSIRSSLAVLFVSTDAAITAPVLVSDEDKSKLLVRKELSTMWQTLHNHERIL